MKYLGVVKNENGMLRMPDAFLQESPAQTYEALELGGDVRLVPSPLDRGRLEQIDRLTRQSIDEHRRALGSLAR